MKKIIFLIFISLILSSNSIVKAVFNVENNKATYDPNIGLLTIYSDFTLDGDYNVHFDKIKFGNINIKGTYRFEKDKLKIYINNKEYINNQEGYTKEGVILKNLSLEKGAIVRTYRPPNSINIVFDSPSNEIILNTHIIALKPVMNIDSFTADITTLSSNGGNIKFLVKGNNLVNHEFEIRNSNSTMKYKMSVENMQAFISINIPPNYLEKDIIMEYNLYCNNYITDKKILITILSEQIEKEDNNNIKPDDNLPNIKPDDSLPNNKPDDILNNNDDIKNDENTTEDIVDLEEKNDESNVKSEINTTTNENSHILYYILGIIILSIGILIYILIRKKYNFNKK